MVGIYRTRASSDPRRSRHRRGVLSIPGTLTGSGPHAAVGVGVSGYSDLITFRRTSAATAVGVAGYSDVVAFLTTAAAVAVGAAARQIHTALQAFASTAVGVSARSTRTNTIAAATAVWLAAASDIIAFVTTSAATAIGIAGSVANFISGALIDWGQRRRMSFNSMMQRKRRGH